MQPLITNNQQLEQRQIQAQGDVRLLEKKHADLISSLERLQKTKTREFETYTQEINKLKTEHKELTKTVNAKNKELSELIDDIDTVKKNLKYFTEGEIAQINKAIQSKLDVLESREKLAAEKDEQLAETLMLLTQAEEDISKRDGEVSQKIGQLKQMETDLAGIADIAESRRDKATEELVLVRGELVDTKEKLKEAKSDLIVLNDKVMQAKENADAEILAKEKFLRDLERREKEVAAKETFNKDWFRRLAEKSTFLTQREEAVGRNVDKLKQKGINL